MSAHANLQSVVGEWTQHYLYTKRAALWNIVNFRLHARDARGKGKKARDRAGMIRKFNRQFKINTHV